MEENKRLCITNGPIIGVNTNGDITLKSSTSCGTTLISGSTIDDVTRVVSVDYKSMADELMREIHERSQRATNLFSEETAVRLSKDFPMALKRAKRKRYKPNFTL